MADWASSASLIIDIHSAGSRLEVTTVAGFAVPLDDEFVEVVGLGGIERAECEVIEDEQVDAGEFTHLGLEGVVQTCSPQSGEELVGA